MLVASLVREGFQKPVVELDLVLEGGARRKLPFDASLETSLPRPLSARSVTFRVSPGQRWHIGSVEFSGLRVVSAKIATSYYRENAMLFVFRSTNAYSPARVDNSADALLELLQSKGYADAEVHAVTAGVSAADGAVALQVTVSEGPYSQVAGLRHEGGPTPGLVLPAESAVVGLPWTPALRTQLLEAVRTAYLKNGYADARVQVLAEREPVRGALQPVSLVLRVQSGKVVHLGRVRFEGNEVTRDSVLQRTVRRGRGGRDLLNPAEVERQRQRLSRLGVFERVSLRYEPREGETRDVVFTLVESERREANLLFGYGSYEQLRGGVELLQGNILGRAHQARLLLVQSMKSSSGELTYSVPELFGESIDGTARLFGLQRQEQAFRRQEFGLELTLRRAIRWLRAEGMVGYTFQALRNQDNDLATHTTDQGQVNVVSTTLGLTGDRRDNPLRPRHGYRWFGRLELAARALGSVAEYQRLEVGGAYHTPWGEGHWLHLAFTQGVLLTLGTNDTLLPVNKRFFPGGDNSIRGFQEGEAAPRAADGLFVGAKSYALLNVEVEQAVTSNWSVIGFVDALGIAARLGDYPFAEKLYSVGLGFRYQTLIGPLRMEYGHNLNPRRGDPKGTLQLSIGAAF